MSAKKKKSIPLKGRPTKYKPEYCEEIIKYFDREPYEIKTIEHYKNGVVAWVEEKKVACDLPLFEGFAKKLGVSRETLHEWRRSYPEFMDAYERARDLQRGIMVINSLENNYNSNFAIRAMANMHNWRDKQSIDQVSKVYQMPSIKLEDGSELEFDVGEKVSKK